MQGYQMTIYNQILYVTSFSACFSLLGLLSAGQLMPAIRWVVCARGVAVVAVFGSEGGAVGGWEAGRLITRAGKSACCLDLVALRFQPLLAQLSWPSPTHLNPM
jgi:hypothetical protein